MALKKWNQISSKTVFKNKFWEYRLDEFEIESGFKGKYHYVHSRGSSVIIPITSSGKLILVKQFRYLNQWESIEFPCGGIDSEITPEENAMKELREETGYSADVIKKTGMFEPYSGVCNEISHVFVASGLVHSPLPKDNTEEFELLELTIEEFELLITSNKISDGMTLAAWLISKQYILELLDKLK